MIWVLKNWRWLLATVICAAAFFYWRVDRAVQYRAGYARAEAQGLANQAKLAAAQAETARAASEDYQVGKFEREKKGRDRYKAVQNIVERPVYIHQCIDANGLQLINQAIDDDG